MQAVAQYMEVTQKLPFQKKKVINHPVSLYAASKKANNLWHILYSHLYEIPYHRAKIFYSVWTLGEARYGFVSFYKSYLRR